MTCSIITAGNLPSFLEDVNVIGGLNMTMIRTIATNEGEVTKKSFSGNPGLYIGLEKAYKVDFLIGITLTQRGLKYEKKDTDMGDTYEQNSKLDYLTLKFLYTQQIGEITAYGGIEPGIILFYTYDNTNVDGGGNVTGFSSLADWLDNDRGIFDLGITLGADYKLNDKMILHGGYNLGLLNIYDDDDQAKSHSLLFGVKYSL